MGMTVRLRKGFDIKLAGKAAASITDIPATDIFAVKPTDFQSLTPKLLIRQGDEILAGQALFFDKANPDIKFPSPVSGEIVDIVRGDKRKVLEIKILADKSPKNNTTSIPANLDVESVKNVISQANLWPVFRQRPFAIIANPADTPKAIFVSTFDTAPLAPDLGYVIAQNRVAFDKGLAILDILSGQKLHVGVDARQPLEGIKNGEVHQFSGPHPAGNVGIQIHHISPVKIGEVAWYIDAQDVIMLGKLFSTGTYDPSRMIAITGSEINNPEYLNLRIGQSLSAVYEQYVVGNNVRFIQGNVLTGVKSHQEDYLSFYTSQLTAIPEGDEPEFLGWLVPSPKKLSLSRALPSWLMPNKIYKLDTNLHGEERAFVMSGQYEKVLPMNIYPVHLLKSILAKDIERMEALGIYEIAEEDMALCEFVCTSKINVQEIVREGLELMRTEV